MPETDEAISTNIITAGSPTERILSGIRNAKDAQLFYYASRFDKVYYRQEFVNQLPKLLARKGGRINLDDPELAEFISLFARKTERHLIDTGVNLEEELNKTIDPDTLTHLQEELAEYQNLLKQSGMSESEATRLIGSARVPRWKVEQIVNTYFRDILNKRLYTLEGENVESFKKMLVDEIDRSLADPRVTPNQIRGIIERQAGNMYYLSQKVAPEKEADLRKAADSIKDTFQHESAPLVQEFYTQQTIPIRYDQELDKKLNNALENTFKGRLTIDGKEVEITSPEEYLKYYRQLTLENPTTTIPDLDRASLALMQAKEAQQLAESGAVNEAALHEEFLKASATNLTARTYVSTLTPEQKKAAANTLVEKSLNTQSVRDNAQKQTHEIIDTILRATPRDPGSMSPLLLTQFKTPQEGARNMILLMQYHYLQKLGVSPASPNTFMMSIMIGQLRTMEMYNALGTIMYPVVAGSQTASRLAAQSLMQRLVGGTITQGAAQIGFRTALASFLGITKIAGGAAVSTGVGVGGRAALGALLGSFFSPVGTVIFAIGGAVIGPVLKGLRKAVTEGKILKLLPGFSATLDALTGAQSAEDFKKFDRNVTIFILVAAIIPIILFSLGALAYEGMRMSAIGSYYDEETPPDAPGSGLSPEQLADARARTQAWNQSRRQSGRTPPAFNYDGPTPPQTDTLLCPVTADCSGFTQEPADNDPNTHGGSHDTYRLNAFDLACVNGTPVYATHDAYIYNSVSGAYEDRFQEGEHTSPDNPSYGNFVYLVGTNSSGQTFGTLYTHLASLSPIVYEAINALKTGGPPVSIPKGTQIGTVDDNGSSSGPHLHYERRGPGGTLTLPENCPP